MDFETKIRKFVWSIADIKVSFDDNEGSYFDDEEEAINIDLHDLQNDKGFFRHLRTAHKCEWWKNYSPLLWTILHEVGHYYTLNDFDMDDEMDERFALSMVSDDALDMPEVQDRYFNLPTEWAATEWAIQFIKDNPEYCKEFDSDYYFC